MGAGAFGPPMYDCSLPVGRCTPPTMELINSVWQSSITACPCNTDAYYYGSCNGNAFFYPTSPGYVFYDSNLLNYMVDRTGRTLASAIVLAHESGHAIQYARGISFPLSISTELSADCFAGYWLGVLQCRGVTDMSSMMDAFYVACMFADPTGYPWFAAGAHGSCDQRVNAMQRGKNAALAGADPLGECTAF